MDYITLRNYAARCNNYQTDNSNSITNNEVYKQRDCWGWGQTTGSGTSSMTDVVTFPITYDSLPIVLVTNAGVKANPAAANIGQINLDSIEHMCSYSITVTGFNVGISSWNDSDNLSTGHVFCECWLARGTYAEI